MQLISSAVAATQLNCTSRTIQSHAKKLGLGVETGTRVLLLTPKEVEKLRTSIQGRAGRPSKTPAE